MTYQLTAQDAFRLARAGQLPTTIPAPQGLAGVGVVLPCKTCGLCTTVLQTDNGTDWACPSCAVKARLAAEIADLEANRRTMKAIFDPRTVLYRTDNPALAYVQRGPSHLKALYGGNLIGASLAQHVGGTARLAGYAMKSAADYWDLEGYAIRFTAADVTDLTGDYFDTRTDLKLDTYAGKGALSILWHHGQTTELGDTPIAALKSVELDDVGVWLRIQLDRANRYAEAIRSMAAAGKLGFSSGAIAHLVKRVRDPRTSRARVTVWPFVEASLTPEPAQPYLTKVSVA